MKRRLLLALALLFALLYRENVVAHFSTGSPDGDQYIALARGVRGGTFGFGRGPSYARLPGWPIVLAPLAGDPHRDVVVKRAARLNALLDVGTATAVFVIASELGLSFWAGLLSALLVVLAPPLVLFSTTSLTEPLATLLATWALAAAALRRPLLCGALLGAALLVRIDSLTFVPGLLLLLPVRAWPRLVVAALLTWIPWPLRNVVDFGAPHIAAAEWPAQDGTPLLTGPIHWMRTWSSSAPGEQTLGDGIVFAKRCADTPLLPAMYDGAQEHDALVKVVARCRAEGLTPSVNDDFEALAAQRRATHPLHVWLSLPAQRLVRLWTPPPEREVHWMHLPEAGLPSCWWVLAGSYVVLYLCAAVGAVLLWPGRRRFVVAALAVLVARSALHAFAVPHYVGFRYWVEVLPLLCVLAAAVVGTRERA